MFESSLCVYKYNKKLQSTNSLLIIIIAKNNNAADVIAFIPPRTIYENVKKLGSNLDKSMQNLPLLIPAL